MPTRKEVSLTAVHSGPDFPNLFLGILEYVSFVMLPVCMYVSEGVSFVFLPSIAAEIMIQATVEMRNSRKRATRSQALLSLCLIKATGPA
eukprot:scaffold59958_cov17-Prasinocladus_malaysianus.AAC.1